MSKVFNTNDISKKKVLNPDQVAAVKSWMEAVLNTTFNDFWEDIRDGVSLCEVVNAIKPSTCRKFKKSKIVFVQRANIQIFIEGCKKLGVPQTDCIETRDLFDQQNLPAVVLNIYGLASTAAKIGYTGPSIQGGVKYADKNQRQFSAKQLAKSKSSVPSWNKGGIAQNVKSMDGYGIVKTDKSMQSHSGVQGVWEQGSKALNNKSMDGYGIVKTDPDMQKPSQVQGVWAQGAKNIENKSMDSYGIVKTDSDMQHPSQVQGVMHQGAINQNNGNQMDSYGIVKTHD